MRQIVPEQSELAVAGAVVWSPVRLPCSAPLRLTAAMPRASSSSKVRFARCWQTSVISATAGKARRPREGCCSTAARGCSREAIPAQFFVAGDPDKSLLIKAVRYKDEDLRMPPDGKRLTGAQVADLEAWVKMGAPLPRADVQEDKIKASLRTHWAFQPVKRPAVPAVKNQTLGAITGRCVYPGQT